jgi:hypothetical protein
MKNFLQLTSYMITLNYKIFHYIAFFLKKCLGVSNHVASGQKV